MTTPTLTTSRVCACGDLLTFEHGCDYALGRVTPPGVTPCPCCGEDTWCVEETADGLAEIAAAPSVRVDGGGR